MPELPEVEVVRLGLVPALNGAKIIGVEVFDARSLKRHISLQELKAGQLANSHGRTLDLQTQALRSTDFCERLTGATLLNPARRGKFLWVPIGSEIQNGETGDPQFALFAHLGMSGQLLLREVDAPEDKNVRIRLLVQTPLNGLLRLDFADQRRFGSLAVDRLVPTADGKTAGIGANSAFLPAQAQHIARDVLDPEFKQEQCVRALKNKNAAIKKLLLEQTTVSGIGNIYADEALWLAQIDPEKTAKSMTLKQLRSVLDAAEIVMRKALAEGGTSFDALYVNTQGEAGYFAHSLNAYGRYGKDCLRCQETMIKTVVAGRTSTFCPNCQKVKR